MTTLDTLLAEAGRTLICGAPEGYDAWIVAMLAASRPAGVLHVARDDVRMEATAEAVRFFAPDIEILTLPAWDCLPYDRVSPHPEISSRRVDCLSRLAATAGEARPGRVVLTTVNALLQRVPARAAVAAASFRARVGETIDVAALTDFLVRNGYDRDGTVREPGQYAIRGGLIDIFPPGHERPVRLDLFGDTLERIRRFDPLTQRTTGEENGDETELALVPVGEAPLDEAAIERFRLGYRSAFGAVPADDPLYAAVSEGRRHMGMEHWLPLFHDRLETVLDYVPGAAVTLDHLAEEARDSRLAMIGDYYEAREAARLGGKGAPSEYKPLPPDRLYLDADEWERRLGDRAVGVFSPYRRPAEDKTGGIGAVVDAGGHRGRDFAPERNRPDANVYDAVREHLTELRRQGRRVVMACYSAGARERLAGVLADHGVRDMAEVEHWPAAAGLPAGTLALAVLGLEHGFETDELAVLGEQDILGDRLVRPRRRSRRAENFIAEASMLNPGDLVVHTDHGIGRYQGLRTLDIAGAPHDCVLVVYEGDDKLYVPVENIEVLSRYGSEEAGVALDRLGGAGWQARKARLKKRIREMADELIRVAAARALRPAMAFAPQTGVFDEFCARFPYHETDDQRRAIDETVADLAAGRPMDRLICGDVGFGKTEVALRAACIVALEGRQVAVVAPTTLLVRQHYQSFSQRFADLPVRIEQLSRLVPAKRQAEVRQGLESGDIDIVIGTHALLSKRIAFRDLGLLIVDEEQRFGVAHKERLKGLKSEVHVLTLSATPIPRTLQFALSGLRGLSLIATPPVDRLAVRTFVLPFDPVVVREAVLREHYRGGQTFFVCPRIEDLPEAAEFLREQVPEVKFNIAHGRMAARDLESVMNAFYDGAFDVLLSTDIIESGLDIPTANTLVVMGADRFGLAQLYQLRGRIGRSKIRAYAYFTLPPRRLPTAAATKRLDVLQALDSLGAGFSLASHDLDLRGGGNLLGEEQSGHVREVGIELYQAMLEEAVAAARGEAPAEESWSPQINLGAAVLIPEGYVADLGVRLELYRRLARLEDEAEIEGFAAELIDRFGPLPEEVEHLLAVVEIKRLCRRAEVERIEAGPRGATLAFRDNRFPNPAGLVEFITREPGAIKLRPDHRLVYVRHWDDPTARYRGVRSLLQKLAGIAAQGAVSPAARAKA